MAFIEIDNLSKKFYGREVLSNLSIGIESRITGILGSSGSGKTTLLRILAGLESPDSGRIAIDGQCVFDSESGIFIPPEKRNVGMIFQDLALWPHMTVEEHLNFVLKARETPKDGRKQKIDEYLKMVCLSGKRKSYPRELSGGEKQRVAIIRALAQESRVLLMDEPLSNLDQILRNDFKREIKRILEKFDITIVYVTHSYLDIIGIADMIAIMGDGSIIQYGKTEDVYKNPGNDFVSEILGISGSK